MPKPSSTLSNWMPSIISVSDPATTTLRRSLKPSRTSVPADTFWAQRTLANPTSLFSRHRTTSPLSSGRPRAADPPNRWVLPKPGIGYRVTSRHPSIRRWTRHFKNSLPGANLRFRKPWAESRRLSGRLCRAPLNASSCTVVVSKTPRRASLGSPTS